MDGDRLTSSNAEFGCSQKDVMVVGEGDERQERRYSNGEINRELTTLKRILNLARQNGKLMHVPHIPMLKERNVRTGFFEREQIDRILARLPAPIRPAFSSRTSPAGASQARCSPASNRDGHNPGTVEPDRGPRLRVSL